MCLLRYQDITGIIQIRVNEGLNKSLEKGIIADRRIRTQPQDIKAEQSVLGAIFIDERETELFVSLLSQQISLMCLHRLF